MNRSRNLKHIATIGVFTFLLSAMNIPIAWTFETVRNQATTTINVEGAQVIDFTLTDPSGRVRTIWSATIPTSAIVDVRTLCPAIPIQVNSDLPRSDLDGINLTFELWYKNAKRGQVEILGVDGWNPTGRETSVRLATFDCQLEVGIYQIVHTTFHTRPGGRNLFEPNPFRGSTNLTLDSYFTPEEVSFDPKLKQRNSASCIRKVKGRQEIRSFKASKCPKGWRLL